MAYVRGHYRRTPSGMTYVRPHHRSSGAGNVDVNPLVLLALFGLIFGAMILVWIVNLIATHIVGIVLAAVGIGAVIGVAYITATVVRAVRERKTARYLNLCRTFARDSELVETEAKELRALSLRLPTDLQTRVVGEEQLFEEFVAQILADGHVDEREQHVLGELLLLFSLDVARAEMIKIAAFDGLIDALGGELDEEHEEMLCEVAVGLGLQTEEVVRRLQPLVDRRERARHEAARRAEWDARTARERAEREAQAAERSRREAAEEAERAATAARARAEREARIAKERASVEALTARLEAERRAARELEFRLTAEVLDTQVLKPIDSSVRLAKRERAWYETPAVEVKGFKKGDRRQSGTLVVSDRRLLFVSDGSIAIPMNKILDIAADSDAGLLRVIKDGRKTPFYFEIEHPQVALAHIDRCLGNAA